jgi:undecaprenyl-diphosphatase
VHGPTELLPISSSAHTALLLRRIGWPQGGSEEELGKAFEVALHGGAALAIGIALREELAAELRRASRRKLAFLVLALAPPALVGYTLESTIERRLGGSRTIALGLLAGGVAMGLADLRAPRAAHGPNAAQGPGDGRGHDRWQRGARWGRNAADAGPCDGLLLGLAQALALIPGVSRSGATLTAARARGFDREGAQALSWRVGLPLLLGATALKARRLAQRGVTGDFAATLMLGAGGAFLSTRACSALIAPGRRGRALLPFSVYRLGLAALVARRRPGGA